MGPSVQKLLAIIIIIENGSQRGTFSRIARRKSTLPEDLCVWSLWLDSSLQMSSCGRPSFAVIILL